MKKFIITFLLFLITINIYSQKLDGYKYVFVQTLTYQNGGTDIWGISSKLRTYFANKGFIVLNESSTLPKELQQDPCLMITCSINHTNVVIGINEVTITLTNCKNEVLHSNTGSASGWSVEDDFNKATKRAFSKVNAMTYNFKPSNTPQLEFPEVEKTNETEETIKTYMSSNTIEPIEGIYKSYQNDGMPYYKLGIIKKGDILKAIIIESDFKHWKVGEVKAILEQSSMKDFYSVKWYMGDKTPFETFGSFENEVLLTIELKNPTTGEKRQEKFIKMFPSASKDINIKKESVMASGSGFFVTKGGIVATNAHVVDGASSIEVTVSNEIGTYTYKAKVLLVDNKNDVALIQINDDAFKGLTSIPYAIKENSDVGSNVFTIGYPLNDVMGNNYKVTNGIISSTTGIADDVRYYQISVPIQPGNSGGPLFDKEGNVIGLTTSRLNSKTVGIQVENVNYAIKSSYLLNLYYMLPNTTPLTSSSTLTSKELKEQVKVLKNYVCLIKVF